MRNAMPVIKLDETDLRGRDLEIATACLNKGKLRATKPKGDGEAAYVWRMAAFNISPIPAHHCMPITAEFDLPDQYWGRGNGGGQQAIHGAASRRRDRCKELDAIVDKMVNTVPRNQWHGVVRWGRAFGAI